MNQDKQDNINRQISEQAAEWLDTLANAGPQEQAVFADWVSESPRHLKEFLMMSALNGELSGLDAERRVDVARLLAAAQRNVVPLNTQSAHGAVAMGPDALRETVAEQPESPAAPKTRARLIGARLAAGVATLGLVAWLAYAFLRPAGDYTTDIGEQRTVALTDGSVLQINSRSRLETRLTETARDVQLLEGEALFKVAPDPARPFRVHVDGTIIQAIGTQFNVNQRPSGVTVSVVEGRVRISGAAPIILSAGQEAHINRKGRVEPRGVVDPGNISAWRQHRLVFRDDTLEDIVAEFNRYNTRSQIQLDGDALLSRRYTAVFDASDPDSLLTFLRQDDGLEVADERGEWVVKVREGGKP